MHIDLLKRHEAIARLGAAAAWRTTGGIFISYRRSDSKSDARSICQRLERTFGKRRVFIDVDSIRPGENFQSVLNDDLKRCKIMPDWARPAPETLSLVRIPVSDRSLTRRIGLVWPRASLRLRLVQAFLEQAMTVCVRHPKLKTGRSRAKTSR